MIRRSGFPAVLCLFLLALLGASSAALGREREALPSTDVVPPRQVEDIGGNPGRSAITILRSGTDRPVVGDPFVVPASKHNPESVLGIVAAVETLDGGRLAVYSKPTTLDRAYSDFVIHLGGKTLGQLDSNPLASSSSLLSQFKCDKPGDAGKIKARVDFSQLKPTVYLNLRRREFYFVLAGEPRLELKLSKSGKLACTYAGHLEFAVPIAGSPFVLAVKPAVTADVSGTVVGSISWHPSLALGVSKSPRGVTAIHTLKNHPPTFDAHGTGQAKLFLGANIGLSLAGRAGVEGEVGPEVNGSVRSQGLESCASASAALRTRLSAFADAIITSWKFNIDERDFARRPILKPDCTEGPDALG